MKKLSNKKSHKRTGVKLSKTNRSKFHRSYKKSEMITVAEPGPSKVITYNEDGKVVSFNSWSKGNKQTPTKVAKDAMTANKSAGQSKKELIKNILMKAGYDPTIRYSRGQKKKFTRIVKNSLFEKPKPVTMTKEEALEKIAARKVIRDKRFEELPYRLPIKAGKQRGYTAAELSVKEKPEEREFTYVVQRKRSDDEMRTYDFLTDRFNAESRITAKEKAKKIAKKYSKDSSFAGITIKDSKDNNITYYPKKALAA